MPFYEQKVITYATCNPMEKRILSRRPLNKHAVMSLKKPTLRRFLRSNGQRYKARDRKERLVHLTVYLTDKRPQNYPNHPHTGSTRHKKVPKLQQSPLGCKNVPCTCTFNYIDVMQHKGENSKEPLKFSQSMWNSIFLLSQEPKKLLDESLVGYANFTATDCKYELAVQLREKLMRDEARLKDELLEKEKKVHYSCPECHQNKPALVEPCNHLICRVCHPLQQVHKCPICDVDVTQITEAYEHTLEEIY